NSRNRVSCHNDFLAAAPSWCVAQISPTSRRLVFEPCPETPSTISVPSLIGKAITPQKLLPDSGFIQSDSHLIGSLQNRRRQRSLIGKSGPPSRQATQDHFHKSGRWNITAALFRVKVSRLRSRNYFVHRLSRFDQSTNAIPNRNQHFAICCQLGSGHKRAVSGDAPRVWVDTCGDLIEGVDQPIH